MGEAPKMHIDVDTNHLRIGETVLSGRTKTILFLGDVALANRVGNLIDEKGHVFPFQQLPKDFFHADVVSFDLACCLSDRGEVWEPKPIVLRGKSDYLKVFPQSTNLVASVANNHFLDYGETACVDTLEALSGKGIQYYGIESKIGKRQPLILDLTCKVGMLAYSTCAHLLPPSSQVNLCSNAARDIIKGVEDAKTGVDLLIVRLHQGVEFSGYSNYRARTLSRHVVDAGADLVICHHSHVIQGIENYHGSFIFHGIGNFLIDMDLEEYPESAYTIATRVFFEDAKIKGIRIEPYKLNGNWQPSPLTATEMSYVSKRLFYLSNLLATPFGRMFNDIVAFSNWNLQQFTSLWEMGRRVGIVKTGAYYVERLRLKFKLINPS